MGENAEGAAKGKETGRLLGGRYRLGGVLGRGGMGTVWRARDEVLGRTVAVKELRFPSDIDEEEKRRLITRTLREAKAIARIRNGSAITVFDVVDEDSRPWIVMELVEGRSLADVIKQDGPLTPRRAAEVGLAVLGVLRAAHREGIVHRDVKPSNVLIEEESGRVVLTDFGIAKVEGDPSVTSTGMLVGAPSYISPERARGGRPGPPADMWSLGGLLYAAVEGHPPYDKGSAIATLTAVMTDPLEPPQNAGELEEVIYGLLLKDPEKRLDEPGARALLQSVLDGPEDSERQLPEENQSSTATVLLPLKSPDDKPVRREPRDGGEQPEAVPGPRTSLVKSLPSAPPRDLRSLLPARAAGSGERRRPVGLVVAVVAAVILGLLGAVLAFAMNGDDSGSSGKGEGSSATSGSAGEDRQGGGEGGDGGDGGDDKEKQSDAEAENPDGGEPGESGGDATAPTGGREGEGEQDGAGEEGDGLPGGYAVRTDDRFRFSMAMPEDWSRVNIKGRNSGGEYAERRGVVPKVQVDFTNSPTGSALRAWQLLEAAVAAASTDYRKIEMESVEWRDYPTVSDWHFERREHGERVRVLNRGFKVDDRHGYAIVVTCKVSEWDGEECTTLRETAFRTFEPRLD
ncbi:serine/threonine protein kinase [Streptomyces durbertensis]|uniref:non-specific serine/threonine protein kinase n=1 Tax=Streptomyces durbertensis TaxID=2448886 RepID=A0ABR6EI98_9ACTN|nr:serine/threonine-protein kinase [Streptomyces durbertensis]MBB1244665.1 serine/threonine protein kinase [Streptomyces durbertensis]